MSGTIWLLNKCFSHDCTVGCMRVKSSAKNVIMGTTLLYHCLSCAVHTVVLSAFLPSSQVGVIGLILYMRRLRFAEASAFAQEQRELSCFLTASCTKNECQLLTVHRDKAKQQVFIWGKRVVLDVRGTFLTPALWLVSLEFQITLSSLTLDGSSQSPAESGEFTWFVTFSASFDGET